MRFSILPLATLLVGQLATAAYIPGTSIRIDITTDEDNTQDVSEYSRFSRLGLQDPLVHLTGGVACTVKTPDTSDTGCGDAFKSVTQCSSYCSCDSNGGMSCPATEKCEADLIKFLCVGVAGCGCPRATPKCNVRTWPTPSLCGGGFKSSNDCGRFCSCDKDGNFSCKEAGWCSSQTLTAYCKLDGACSCMSD